MNWLHYSTSQPRNQPIFEISIKKIANSYECTKPPFFLSTLLGICHNKPVFSFCFPNFLNINHGFFPLFHQFTLLFIHFQIRWGGICAFFRAFVRLKQTFLSRLCANRVHFLHPAPSPSCILDFPIPLLYVPAQRNVPGISRRTPYYNVYAAPQTEHAQRRLAPATAIFIHLYASFLSFLNIYSFMVDKSWIRLYNLGHIEQHLLGGTHHEQGKYQKSRTRLFRRSGYIHYHPLAEGKLQ